MLIYYYIYNYHKYIVSYFSNFESGTFDTNKNLFGKTIFGMNDLFWFAFDTNGQCMMLDNLTLSTLRKYDDPYQAMLDCLIVGKI